MSPIVAPSFSERAPGSVPGKSFLLGEYAVLAGHPALVATFGPRFGLSASGSPGFHPRSPAGRLVALARSRFDSVGAPGGAFLDPYVGEGGFGASTAQFALAYAALAERTGWERSAIGARRVYRELMADEPLPPSGADLVAQWLGGVVCLDPRRESAKQCFGALDWRSLLVFSAAAQPGRKVPTHEHLAKLGSALAPGLETELGGILEQGLRGLEEGRLSLAGLGRAMNDYAQALSRAGLELGAALDDRLALSTLPGVVGCKGTGALLADGVAVLLEPGADRAGVLALARSRGLRLVADGLGTEPEPGLSGEGAP